MIARPDVTLLLSRTGAGKTWTAADGTSASNYSGSDVLTFALIAIVLVGIVVAGILAYKGRWRAWYPDLFIVTHMPLAAPWLAGAALLLGGTMGLDVLLDPVPVPVAVAGFFLSVCSLLIGGVYIIHPPRFMLPRWIRWLEGDTSLPDPDRG